MDQQVDEEDVLARQIARAQPEALTGLSVR